MYKCTECQTEYDIKPDYCDCGNDTFIEVPAKSIKNDVNTNTKPETKIPSIKKQEISYHKEPQPKRNSELDRIKKFFDPVSTSIFLICLFWAFGLIISTFSANESAVKINEEKVETSSSEIPANCDGFWKDPIISKIPEPKDVTPIKEPSQNVITEVVNKIVPQVNKNKEINQSKKQVQKPAQKSPALAQTKPQSTKINNQKVSPTSSKSHSAISKNSQIPKIPDNTLNIAKNSAQIKQQSINTNTKTTPAPLPKNSKAISNTSTNTSSFKNNNSNQKDTVQSQPKPVKLPVYDPAKEKQELASYKIALRDTIGHKINFTNVVGDGKCTVSFKINSQGRLVNRSFSQQSPNLTLNDAVFSAVNSTPTFKIPPSGYKNETLNLNVSFYNGNYQISLN